MGLSAGPGSPIHFLCPTYRLWRRRSRDIPRHTVRLTGSWRRQGAKKHCALGIRSSYFAVKYECEICKHVGWTNHVDLVQRAVNEGVLPRAEAETDRHLRVK